MKYQEQVSKNSIPMSRLPDDLEMIGEYYYKNTAIDDRISNMKVKKKRNG